MAKVSGTGSGFGEDGTSRETMHKAYVRLAAGLDDLLKAKRPLLRHLDIELTERCNNNCIHCYINRPVDDPAAKTGELNAEVLLGLLKEAADLGCLSVRFTGGEPLVREDFGRIYLGARKLGLRVGIVTNATLVTEEFVGLVSSVPPLGNVEVTLYGMTRKVYDRVTRTPGSFEAAWRGIGLLLDAGIPIQPRAYLPFDRVNERRRLRDWLAVLPHDAQMPIAGGPLYLRGRRDSESKNKRILGLRPSPQACVDEFVLRTGCYASESRGLLSTLHWTNGSHLFSCGAGKGLACLDAYGVMQPCILLRHPDITQNVVSGRTSMKGVMQGAFSALENIEATNPSFLVRCARCFLRGFCEQCPAQSWMEHGTLDTPVDYFCDVAHEAALRLGLIRNGEKAWNVEDGEERVRVFIEEGTSI